MWFLALHCKDARQVNFCSDPLPNSLREFLCRKPFEGEAKHLMELKPETVDWLLNSPESPINVDQSQIFAAASNDDPHSTNVLPPRCQIASRAPYVDASTLNKPPSASSHQSEAGVVALQSPQSSSEAPSAITNSVSTKISVINSQPVDESNDSATLLPPLPDLIYQISNVVAQVSNRICCSCYNGIT